MTMEEMKKRRCELYHNYVASAKTYMRAKKLFKSIEKRCTSDERLYRQCEYELALLDGRKQVIDPPEERKRKKPKVKIAISDLDPEQVAELLELLEINEEEE